MKLQLKQLNNGKWEAVKVKEIAGNSLVNYMLSNPAPLIAAILENDKPVLFVSNSEEWVNKCKAKGVSLSAKTLKELCGTEVYPKISLDYFLQSEVIEVKTI